MAAAAYEIAFETGCFWDTFSLTASLYKCIRKRMIHLPYINIQVDYGYLSDPVRMQRTEEAHMFIEEEKVLK
jgi:hypothetical protein